MLDPKDRPEESTYAPDDSEPLQRAEPENAPLPQAQELLDESLAEGGGSAISEE